MKAVTSGQRTALAVLAVVVTLVGVAVAALREDDDPMELSADASTPSTSGSTTAVRSTSASLAATDAAASSTTAVTASTATATSAVSQPPPRSTWHTMAEAPIAGRQPAVAVWTGTELIVWGGVTDFSDGCTVGAGSENLCGAPAVFDGAAPWSATAWDPVTAAFTPVDPPPDPSRCNATVVPAGRSLLVWSGFECQAGVGHYLGWTHVGTGVRLDP